MIEKICHNLSSKSLIVKSAIFWTLDRLFFHVVSSSNIFWTIIITMKFTVTSVAKSSARFGLLTELQRIPEAAFETPLLLLHTRGASVPHLSYDLLQMVTNEHHLLQMPLVSLIEHSKNIKAFGKGIAEFAGLKEYLNYATVQDPGTATPVGYHDKNSVSLWTRGGRKLLDPQTYISCMETLKPDLFQAMVDTDTNPSSSFKRVKRSVDDTVKFLRACNQLKRNSEELRETPMLACITGGYNVKERLRCIAEMQDITEVAGFVIEGFHMNGESAAKLNWDEVDPVLTATVNSLPKELPRIFHGAISPIILLKLVSRGIDIFDSTFPWMAAERGGALMFPNSLQWKESDTITETLPDIKPVIASIPDEKDGKPDENEETVDRVYEIDLRDKTFFSDKRPLVEGCSCYSCGKYSRSYIHHLVKTSELQGPMLLMMHNLYHYIQFFHCIRSAVKENQLEALQSKLEDFVSRRRKS
uniref:Queuine tRNA-ribosyltransferase accessory subunit 2 n=1 Tax=Scapholeberis mucronata TaxID=202097 RepID=A0A4Y7NKF2_9CRUS|nr:EOG090X08JG [Scapholeberis mucronata]SVE93700.1 EOG090X08JG [Scapholeberis mucronata]